MAISNNFNISQQNYQLGLQSQIRDSGKNAAAQTVAQGNTGVTKQDKSKEKSETSHLSEAARKAIEQDELKKAAGKGGAEQAGKAASKAKAKEREKTKDGGGDVRGADNGKFYHIPDTAQPGDILPTEDGGSLVVGDAATGVENSKLTPSQTQRFRHLDSDANVQAQYEAIPEKVRPAVMKMAEKQVGDKAGRKKNAELKMGDAKFSNEVEGMVLDPTAKMDPRGKVGKAGIRTPKDEKPKMMEDPHAEDIMKEAARLQVANGGGAEAFVA